MQFCNPRVLKLLVKIYIVFYSLQTDAVSNIKFTWTVRWKPLVAPTQRFVLALWRNVHKLEKQLNNLRAEPGVYIINNSEVSTIFFKRETNNMVQIHINNPHLHGVGQRNRLLNMCFSFLKLFLSIFHQPVWPASYCLSKNVISKERLMFKSKLIRNVDDISVTKRSELYFQCDRRGA